MSLNYGSLELDSIVSRMEGEWGMYGLGRRGSKRDGEDISSQFLIWLVGELLVGFRGEIECFTVIHLTGKGNTQFGWSRRNYHPFDSPLPLSSLFLNAKF